MRRTHTHSVLATSLVAAASISLFTACTSDSDVTEPPGQAHVAEASSCPGEFLYSLANQRTAAGAGVDVTEDDESTAFDDLDGEGRACVAKLVGNRKLPSGAPEPDEYVALYEGDLTDALTTQVESAGFTPSENGIWRREGELLTIRTEDAPRLGIEGEATFTLVSVMESEELADIRVPR